MSDVVGGVYTWHIFGGGGEVERTGAMVECTSGFGVTFHVR